jgi:hypothetical protein
MAILLGKCFGINRRVDFINWMKNDELKLNIVKFTLTNK